MTKSIRIESFNLCPECGGCIDFSLFRGEETCSQCGLIIRDKIFSTRHTGKKGLCDNERISAPVRIEKFYNTDQKRAFKKNTWTDSFQRNLNEAYSEFNRICGNLKLPKIIKLKAQYLYIKVLKKKLVRGHSIKGMVCACIFYSCKKHYFMSLEEVSEQIEGLVKKTKKTVKHVRNCYNLVVKELKLKYQPQNLLSLVPRYISEGGLDKKMITLTTKFLLHCNAESIFNGKDRRGVVAAAIYLVAKKCGFYISQSRLAKISNVTENTIRPRIRELERLI